jgi:proteasome lid subunit RPN8/RPN11
VVVPDATRRALAAHARAEAPNEACGLVLFRDGIAERYVPAKNKAESPYRFELELDPLVWDEINDEYELQGVFHSHLSAPARPSRTDVENIGLWTERPYLIYSIRRDELAAFRISKDGQIEELELSR